MLNLIKNHDLVRSKAYINGKWMGADNHKTFSVLNPVNGEKLQTVSDLGKIETQQAVHAANQALQAWQTQTAKQRGALLLAWQKLILENADDLATLMTLEQGKPLAEAKGEVAYAASFLQWFAEEGKRTYGDVIPTFAQDKRIFTLKQPVGVVAAITPWNFPLAMITRKVAPALAAGCTLVIKPSEETPLSALALAALAEQAEIPAGVLNIVVGKDATAIGAVLTSHPLVRKLSFTGSTAVGKLLMSQCAATVKRTSMELGGNAPFIVFDDADIDAAIQGALLSKYRNAGQTCVCANRILVQENIYEQFADKLLAKVSEFQLGNGLDHGISIGPLINATSFNKVNALVEQAKVAGANVLIGGEAASKTGQHFYQPTILGNVNESMDLFSTEIFGPVAPLYKFKSEDEAIAIANNTPYGLAAYFYAQNMQRIWRVAEKLEYGMVGINEGILSTELAPFGGIKESGIGREGSKYGIDEYLETKYLCMGGIQ